MSISRVQQKLGVVALPYISMFTCPCVVVSVGVGVGVGVGV